MLAGKEGRLRQVCLENILRCAEVLAAAPGRPEPASTTRWRTEFSSHDSGPPLRRNPYSSMEYRFILE
jgi:hypothetical protein